MNKKQTPLIKNHEGLNRNESKSINRLYFRKQFKFQLPKLPNSSSTQQGNQKTIANLIQSLEKINKDTKSQLYPLLNQCIRVLRGEKFLKRDLIMRKIQQTEEVGKQNQILMEQGQNISKSQVINVEKSLIRKIQSKDLFEKVSKVSHMKSQKVTDRQLITLLNNKIQEKEKLIRQLHTRIDELNQSLNKEKTLVMAQSLSSQNILNEKQKLFKQNTIKQQQIKEMNENKKNLNLLLNQKISLNSELIEKCKIFEIQIKERETQIISLWQTALINSNNK